MLPNLLVRTSIVSAAVVSLVGFGTAPATAETIEGEIAHVELHDTPRHLKVRTGGGEVQVPISNRTNVDFDANNKGYFSEELSSLKSGMRVRISTDGNEAPARRVSVLSVPDDLRAPAIRAFEAGRSSDGDGTEMKVRVLDVNRSRGTFRAVFKDSERTFRTDDPKLLSSVGQGDVIVVKVRADDRSQVTDIRSAALVGRVVEVDRTSGRVHVVVDGQERTFKLDRIKGLRLNEGDRIRFQVEERDAGEPTIVEVDKITGVEKVR